MALTLFGPPLRATAMPPLPLNDIPSHLNPLLPAVYISTLFPLVERNVPFLVLVPPPVMEQNLVQPHTPNLILVLVVSRLPLLITATAVPVAGVQPLTMPTLAQLLAMLTILLGLPHPLNIPARTSTLWQVGLPNYFKPSIGLGL